MKTGRLDKVELISHNLPLEDKFFSFPTTEPFFNYIFSLFPVFIIYVSKMHWISRCGSLNKPMAGKIPHLQVISNTNHTTNGYFLRKTLLPTIIEKQGHFIGWFLHRPPSVETLMGLTFNFMTYIKLVTELIKFYLDMKLISSLYLHKYYVISSNLLI